MAKKSYLWPASFGTFGTFGTFGLTMFVIFCCDSPFACGILRLGDLGCLVKAARVRALLTQEVLKTWWNYMELHGTTT